VKKTGANAVPVSVVNRSPPLPVLASKRLVIEHASDQPSTTTGTKVDVDTNHQLNGSGQVHPSMPMFVAAQRALCNNGDLY
jgi:hypothetical protein